MVEILPIYLPHLTEQMSGNVMLGKIPLY